MEKQARTDRHLDRIKLTKRAVYTQKTFFHLPYRNKIISTGIHHVVFESDDWGMCGEMKDSSTLQKALEFEHKEKESLLKIGYNNTLESYDDLVELYSILKSFKDSFNRSTIFTANYVMCNPDFSRIESSGFAKHYGIPISLGFPEGWDNRGPVIRGWKEGITLKVWRPEFHGLTHFNFKIWMDALRKKENLSTAFFEMGVVNYQRRISAVSEYSLDYKRGVFEPYHEQFYAVSKGCEIFRALFGYSPLTTIPPHDVWNFDTEVAFLKCGLRFIQTERVRMQGTLFPPTRFSNNSFESILAASLARGVLVKVLRNIWLEPSDEVEYAMNAYKYVTRNGFPAVINTHRANYVTAVNPHLGILGRRKLSELLRFLTEDPRICFLTMSELSQLYTQGYSLFNSCNEILIRNSREQHLKLPYSFKKFHATDLSSQNSIDNKISFTGSKTIIPPLSNVSFSL